MARKKKNMPVKNGNLASLLKSRFKTADRPPYPNPGRDFLMGLSGETLIFKP